MFSQQSSQQCPLTLSLGVNQSVLHLVVYWIYHIILILVFCATDFALVEWVTTDYWTRSECKFIDKEISKLMLMSQIRYWLINRESIIESISTYHYLWNKNLGLFIQKQNVCFSWTPRNPKPAGGFERRVFLKKTPKKTVCPNQILQKTWYNIHYSVQLRSIESLDWKQQSRDENPVILAELQEGESAARRRGQAKL